MNIVLFNKMKENLKTAVLAVPQIKEVYKTCQEFIMFFLFIIDLCLFRVGVRKKNKLVPYTFENFIVIAVCLLKGLLVFFCYYFSLLENIPYIINRFFPFFSFLLLVFCVTMIVKIANKFRFTRSILIAFMIAFWFMFVFEVNAFFFELSWLFFSYFNFCEAIPGIPGDPGFIRIFLWHFVDFFLYWYLKIGFICLCPEAPLCGYNMEMVDMNPTDICSRGYWERNYPGTTYRNVVCPRVDIIVIGWESWLHLTHKVFLECPNVKNLTLYQTLDMSTGVIDSTRNRISYTMWRECHIRDMMVDHYNRIEYASRPDTGDIIKLVIKYHDGKISDQQFLKLVKTYAEVRTNVLPELHNRIKAIDYYIDHPNLVPRRRIL